MRALKLVQHMKTNAEVMSDQLVDRIRSSGRCKDLLQKVPESEQKQYGVEIFRDLTEWLANEADAIIEQQYVSIGVRRRNQGVPISDLFCGVSTAREYLWDYMQQECLYDEAVDFWGGVQLLKSLNRFFDRVFYFALLGYQNAELSESAAMSFVAKRRSA